MEAYAAVKYQFLQDALTKKLVINGQDLYGQRWLPELRKTHEVITFGVQAGLDRVGIGNTVYASSIHYLPHGIEAMVHSGDEQGVLSLPLLGEFNVSNALAVLSTLISLEGASLNELLPYFKELKSVPGRMQVMGGGDQPLIVIDYAHTPDALEKALLSLRDHTKERLVCVFGCGGDRDRSKRSEMGSIAARLADHVILTNDNPRSEDPRAILEEIMCGIKDHSRLSILPDRSKAIENSIQYARSGDVILIAGKGAERFQYVGSEAIPFLDEEEVRRQLMA